MITDGNFHYWLWSSLALLYGLPFGGHRGKILNQGGRDKNEKSALATISNRADGTEEPDSDGAYGN